MRYANVVQREHIAGNVARFTYDSIVDRDLIVVAEDLESLQEAPKHGRKSQEERAADMIQKMGNLLGKSEPTSPGSLLAAHAQPNAGSCCQKKGVSLCCRPSGGPVLLWLPAKCLWAR